MQQKSVYRLVESALLLAMAAVLSVIKIIDMPYGGSVTAFSMLPLLIIAYRYGTKWGMLTAFTYSLIQLLLGMENFSYVTGFTSMAALALFDYLLAFLVLGLGALFRRQNTSQTASLVLAAVVTGVLRYLCHCVSGFTVWRDLSVPFSQSLAYSLSYNATYMIPKIIILAIGAVYISRVLSFDNAGITRVAAQKTARIDEIDKRAVIAQHHAGCLQLFSDAVFRPHLNATQPQQEAGDHVGREKMVGADLFGDGGFFLVLFNIGIQLSEQSFAVDHSDDEQSDQQQENTGGDHPAMQDGHVADTDANANRGEAAKERHGGVAGIFHARACREKANHTVGDGRQAIQNKDDQDNFVRRGGAVQIDLQIRNEIVAKLIAEQTVDEVDHKVAHQNAGRADEQALPKSKGQSGQHLNRLGGKEGQDHLQHGENADGNLTAKAHILKLIAHFFTGVFFKENAADELVIIAE